MNEIDAVAAPPSVRASSLDMASQRSFLSDVVIEHGPRAELNTMFLRADTHLREMGVRLTLGSFDELMAVNRANRDNWAPLLPLFDPALNDIDPANSVTLLGRNASGKVVVTVAARLYNLGQHTLAEEIESLRLLYRDPASVKLPDEEIQVSSPVARATRGKAVFSGAAWIHPDYRKQSLLDPAVPVVRGLGLTKWMPDLTFSFMVPELIKNGTARRWYMNVDWEITMINTPVKRGGTIHAGMSWTRPDLMLHHFAEYAASRSSVGSAEVDGSVGERSGNQQRVV